METYHLDAHGQSVSLSIDSRLHDPTNKKVLGPYDCFAAGAASELGITLLYGKRRRALVDEDFFQVRHYRGKAGSHIIRQLVCFLASYHARTFELVHGTGLLVESSSNKGILLVGRGRSGKSTLSRHLSHVIMDDDLMLVTHERMSVTGKLGFVTYRHPETGRKYLTPLPSGIKEANLSLVLILDKTEQGGKFWDIDNTIPRRFAVPEDLPPKMLEAYLRMPAIRVNAPIYRLGTRGRLKQTLKILHHVVDQHI